MAARPPRRRNPAARREILANWLALLALLALGVVWPGEDSASAAAHGACDARAPAAAAHVLR